MFTAIYMRVSSSKQETKSQEAELLAYKAAVEGRETARVYREKGTGTNYEPARMAEDFGPRFWPGKCNASSFGGWIG